MNQINQLKSPKTHCPDFQYATSPSTTIDVLINVSELPRRVKGTKTYSHTACLADEAYQPAMNPVSTDHDASDAIDIPP